MRVYVQMDAGGRVVGEARGSNVAIQLAGQEGVTGFRPTELLLIGLGGCIMGYVSDYSRLKGLPTNVQITLEDRLEEGRPGIAEITVSINGAIAGDPEAMEELIRIIRQQCKLYNTISSGAKVTLQQGENEPVPGQEQKDAGQETALGSSCGLRPGSGPC